MASAVKPSNENSFGFGMRWPEVLSVENAYHELFGSRSLVQTAGLATSIVISIVNSGNISSDKTTSGMSPFTPLSRKAGLCC